MYFVVVRCCSSSSASLTDIFTHLAICKKEKHNSGYSRLNSLFLAMLNIFRLGGDLAHVISIVLLILRLRVSKNANGISMKTQELYLLVFVTRYLDLFTTFYSLYNTLMKIMYISATIYILYMVRYTEPFKTNYDASQDSFLHWKFAVAPVAVVALITCIYEGFDILEVTQFSLLPLSLY